MSGQSLYKEVYQKILQAIHSGEYVENEALPSERCLSEKYHVSRSTIRQALDCLKDHKYIYTIPGNGSFIKPQVFEQSLNHLYSFTDGLRSVGFPDTAPPVSNHVLAYESIVLDKGLALSLGYPVGTPFHRLVRLRFGKQYPLMIETTYLCASRIHRLDIDYLEGRGSLYVYLKEKYDFQVQHATESLRPVMPSNRERELLCISPSVPCLLLERYSYEDGQVIEYTQSTIRGDKYIFRADLYPKE